METLLKQLLKGKGVSVPEGPYWHREVLELGVGSGLISAETQERLKPFLAFRHFVAHGYPTDLDPDRMMPLVGAIREAYRAFIEDITRTTD